MWIGGTRWLSCRHRRTRPCYFFGWRETGLPDSATPAAIPSCRRFMAAAICFPSPTAMADNLRIQQDPRQWRHLRFLRPLLLEPHLAGELPDQHHRGRVRQLLRRLLAPTGALSRQWTVRRFPAASASTLVTSTW